MVPKFTIVFNGVELGSTWSFLVGLGYLHRLIRQPGIMIPVDDSSGRIVRCGRGYKFGQEESDDGKHLARQNRRRSSQSLLDTRRKS